VEASKWCWPRLATKRLQRQRKGQKSWCHWSTQRLIIQIYLGNFKFPALKPCRHFQSFLHNLSSVYNYHQRLGFGSCSYSLCRPTARYACINVTRTFKTAMIGIRNYDYPAFTLASQTKRRRCRETKSKTTTPLMGLTDTK